uniref:Hox9 N-terminal activation domain-containing protein n=1 Tax=Cyprinus carpio TaxID=7962 RepID=A0A8C2AFE4_CYPCA
MSTSSALSSYYVDSIMGHDTEDVYGARYVQGSHTVRPSGVGENADFSSCSFAPKSAAFPASWTSLLPRAELILPSSVRMLYIYIYIYNKTKKKLHSHSRYNILTDT